MTESVQTTLEEASRCPKCEQPGELVGKQPIHGRNVTRGAELLKYACRNPRCRWFDDICRVVQVNPDGTIPQPMRRDKEYPAIPDRTDEVNAAVERQLELEKQGGAEVARG